MRTLLAGLLLLITASVAAAQTYSCWEFPSLVEFTNAMNAAQYGGNGISVKAAASCDSGAVCLTIEGAGPYGDEATLAALLSGAGGTSCK